MTLALAFAVTNGLHDASNATAALVATRTARPAQAVVLAAVFNLLGPLLLGAAVADTVGSVVETDDTAVIAAALAAAVAWNLLTWTRGLPASSGHALVGGLIGAGVFAGATVEWGAVTAVLVALALSPLLGAAAGLFMTRGLRRAGRRATRRWRGPVGGAAWATSAALAFGHGANDAQKSVGVIAALLVADGRATSLGSPTWAAVACAAALTLGTALGGWRIVRTIGRRIVRLQPLDAVAGQGASAGVIVAASALGAPVSTTQVVASSVVGVGGGRRRWRHVHWAVVREMALGWVVTLPVTAVLAGAAVTAWGALA
ncbi:MAG TPA: inorganic phosphate transporter [Solirubrobacter sp.]|nr:inorganic phosphate transporter [Solirubrobacter sp.]